MKAYLECRLRQLHCRVQNNYKYFAEDRELPYFQAVLADVVYLENLLKDSKWTDK